MATGAASAYNYSGGITHFFDVGTKLTQHAIAARKLTAAMASLEIREGDIASMREFTHGPVAIGRQDGNDFQVVHPSVSKKHAELTLDGDTGRWKLVDLGSSNGTFVDGKPVKHCMLGPYARIRIGTVEVIFTDNPSFDARQSPIVASMRVAPPGDKPSPDDPTQIAIPPGQAEKKLRAIQLIGERIVDRLIDPGDLAGDILEILLEEVGADRGFIGLFEEGVNFKPLATRGDGPAGEARISRTVLRQLLDDRAGVLIQDVGAEELALESLMAMSVASTLCAPLWTSRKIVGFISLDRLAGGEFNEGHLDFLMAVAHQAAIGLERLRLATLAEKEQNVRTYLSRYLDSKVVRQIACEHSNSEVDPLTPAERKVTILFCDIVSFTKMSEGLPPVVLADFMREYLTHMTEIILSAGGTIDKNIGDEVMALLGAPVQLADAACDAIQAAIKMMACVEKLEAPGADRLRIRTGIATGMAVVGNMGSVQRIEYTALGDTVNVASRLESFARPGEICIDDATLDAVGASTFDVQEIGVVDVKNRNRPIRVFNVNS